MNSNQSLEFITRLEEKIRQLVKKHIELEKTCAKAQDENKALKDKVAELQANVEAYEREKTIQSLSAITDESQKMQLKKYLDVLIKNIDDNIQLLK